MKKKINKFKPHLKTQYTIVQEPQSMQQIANKLIFN